MRLIRRVVDSLFKEYYTKQSQGIQNKNTRDIVSHIK